MKLYDAKAELFRTLGHPTRIRVLEILQAGPTPVRDILAELDLEASNLSQQLAVLRRAGLVSATRTGSTVLYELATPEVAALLAAGRAILSKEPVSTDGLLAAIPTRE
ncbi:ArsR/SmtB family transcription factor [Nocardioides sp.]|uniref:ArsR/SmtB family transcription factor n=1 Tax=Nocardioides sp. TaxID=35761 RepID=UPI0039E31E5E